MRSKPLLFFFLLVGCTHSVYRLDVDQPQQQRIEQELTKSCGDSCEIEKCWSEKQDVLVCTVNFSFFSDYHKSKVLTDVSKRLHADQLQVGFCGQDTFATSMAGAFVFGLVAGALGGGSTPTGGGGPSGGVAAMAHPPPNFANDQASIEQACSSVPVEDLAL